MTLTFPIQTVSEANQREHWAKKSARKKSQQKDFAMYWRINRASVQPPATITFTRFSCKTLDTDNLAGAFKHVQDQLAREMGIDDGSELITWVYAQERIPTRDHYFTVEIK